MKINPLSVYGNNDKQQAQKAASEAQRPKATVLDKAPAEESARGDVVHLSDRSRQIARAQELALSAPEIRQAKVDDIKNRLANGTYNVSAQTVATAILTKSITEV